ncbi:LysE family translocator [Shewanella sp. A32]|uniref:LysE family translocator n=1 Tax=Shewanella sp. A32 TaxID=3031327 RepID=UPI0023B8D84B|nr:LysE family translocator [Shewanella sp. A32]MDF0534398.1 LysE family translocator [Shewanella sp. A32]
MSWISLLLTLGTVHIAALVAPGPDFALMLRASVVGGRRYAFFLALGLASAIMLHTITVTFAAALLQRWLPGLMLWLPWCAALWLGYLGYGCLQGAFAASPAGKSNETVQKPRVYSRRHGWWTGFATNALNPKAYVYFFSVIAGMLPLQSPLQFKLALVTLFFSLALLWFAFLGWALNIPRFSKWLQRNNRGILVFSGMILLLFALLLLLQGYQRLLG